MSNNDGRILYLTMLHFSMSFSFYRGYLQFYMYFVSKSFMEYRKAYA